MNEGLTPPIRHKMLTGTGIQTPTLVLLASLVMSMSLFIISLLSFLAFLAITQERAPSIVGVPNGKEITEVTREIRESRDTRDNNVRVLPKSEATTPVG